MTTDGDIREDLGEEEAGYPDLSEEEVDLLSELSEYTDDELNLALEGLPDVVVESLLATVTASSSGASLTLPATPVAQAREIDAGYRQRDHLDYLSDRLTAAVEAVERGESRKILVSMPPRSGKSQLTSTYFPLWLLRRHPSWKLGLISHSDTLSIGWGREVRRILEENRERYGVRIAHDAGAASHWQTEARGSVTARSVGQSVTGLGFKVLLIDDAVKDFAAAHSELQRKKLWEWWTINATTRLEPPALVVMIGCLTAETPVLLEDGREVPIADVRPGDRAVTYDEEGGLAVSSVTNWANQGPDDVYTVTMASGKKVRANAKHPFLTITESGERAWKRTDELRAGENLLAVVGADGAASRARRTDASFLSARRASADPTTGAPTGPPAANAGRPSSTAALTSGTDTGWSWSTTSGCWIPRTASARFATVLRTLPTPEERVSSSWTTATIPEMSEGSSATTATSSSATARPLSVSAVPSPTSALTSDRIVSVELTGREDVYDVEVDGTHTFIANGLVTHNTRWHEDDLIGRVRSPRYEGDPSEWEVISFPALAEEGDVLGREPGEPLISPLVEETPEEALERWGEIKRTVGSYGWASLYQQRPSPARGAIFDVGWWRYWTTDPTRVTDDGRVVLFDPSKSGRWLDSWDTSFKGEGSSDFVVGQRWCRQGANRFLVAQQRGRWSFTQTLERMRQWGLRDAPLRSPYGHLVHERLIEEAANGAAIIDTLRDEIPGIRPIKATRGKEARARAITPEVESGNVYLPLPEDDGNEWVGDLLSELRAFPHGSNDDQVDALDQALAELRESGVPQITVPGRAGRTIDRNVGSAARSSLTAARRQRGPGGR